MNVGTVSQEVLEALEYALRLEDEGYEFYERLSKITKDPRGRRMYERLRNDERTHREVIERELAALRETGAWTGDVASVPSSTVFDSAPPIFDTTKAVASGAARARELQALERGMEAEIKSRDFYAQQAKRADSPGPRGMWTRLSEIEQAHLDLLTWEHDSLRGEGYWMDIAQFSMDEL
jgi:rubrerythrin